MVYYFAYGSNMDEGHLNKWCSCNKYKSISFENARSAKLNDYKLCFNYYSKKRWDAGAANIMKSEGKCVYGLLLPLNVEQLKSIRKKEGCKNPERKGAPNCYDEIKVEVELLDIGKKKTNVITYKAAKHKEKDAHQPPTESYMQLIIKNAKKYNFPSEYIRCLESIETKKGN